MTNVSSSNSLGENVPKLRFPEFEGEWSLINISELLDFQNGINADSDKYGIGIKYISVSDILNNPYICYDDIKGLVDIDNSTLEHYKVEYGDIVFQRSSETFEDIGHANVYLDKSRPATFGGFVIRGKKRGNYIPFFFKNLLDTPYARKATTRMGAGAQHYNIGQDGLSKIALYFPKINEQEKIADLFMILNKKIKLQRELVKSLKLYKRGLLSKFFPQNGENIPQYRFKGFTDAWKQRKLSDIGDVITGSTPSTQHPEYYSEDGIPWVTPTDITDNLIYDTPKKLSPLGEKVGRVVPAETILVTCIASIGKNTMLVNTGSFNQQINGLVPNKQKYDPYFLLTESHHWSAKMKREAAAGTMQIVNKNEFSSIETYIPDLPEQQAIGTLFRQMDNLITLHQEKCYSYKKIKSALLQQMFM